MFATIKSQLILFGALAATFIALLGGTSLFAVRQLQTALDDTTRDALAIRNHLQGDMMHDALRGDVLAGALAAKTNDAKGIAAAAKQVEEHFKEFQGLLAANLEAKLSPAIDADLRALQPVVQGYGTQAQLALKDMAGDQMAADRGVEKVVAVFEKLEVMQAATRDKIEAQVRATQERSNADSRRALLLVAAAGIAATLLSTVFGVLLYRRITQPLVALRSVVDRVNGGDMQARAKLDRADELGAFSNAFDKLLDERIAGLDKTARENEQLNNSVISLLQTVFQLSNKDLTARAEVTEDVIGTLSSSINQFSDETSRTLAEVNSIATQVRETSEAVSAQASRVDERAQDDRSSLEQMSNNLQRATKQLMQVAQLSDDSNKAAERASSATDGALRAVSATVRGMDDLRDSISETEKRFKRLGERSQEISSAVSLINTISERTHMLAMNASMQAATAGEAGRGFAVVAEEVQRLSESSRQATTTISQLVQNIQLETNETLYTMNRLISQVVSQSEQAQRAGEQMTLSQSTTAQLVQLVQQIANFSEQQSLLARELQLSVTKLNKGSEQTVSAISEQSRSTVTLVDFSRRLAESVAQFKLPQTA
jgi:methyl-accepting chemotaxis protein